MKKLLSVVLFLLISVSGFAQFNRSYLLSDRRFYPGSILKTSFGALYTTASTVPDPISGYGYGHFIMELDDNGDVQRSEQITDQYVSTTSKIMEVENEQLLFVTYSVKERAVIIVKFDRDLNYQWSTKIPAEWYVHANIDMVRQAGNDEAGTPGCYYVGYSDKIKDPNNPEDYAYCLAKVDMDGAVLWNNKYFMGVRPNLYSLQDRFGSICAYTDRNGRFRVAIAGTRHEESPVYLGSTLGILVVNDDGSVDNYWRLSTSSNYEYKSPHIGYDAGNDAFIVSTLERYTGFGSMASEINLLKINDDFSGASCATYTADCENYNMAVYKANNSNEYLLGSTVAACSLPGGGNYINTFGLFRVDASTLGVNDFIRYNIYSQRPTALMSNNNTFCIDEDDNCYMMSEKILTNWQFDQQVMKTDNAGESCGAVHLMPDVDTRSFATEIVALEYKPEEQAVEEYEPEFEHDGIGEEFRCEDYPQGQFKIAPISTESLLPMIYPTYLSSAELITVRLTDEYVSNSTLSVYDLQGRKILSRDIREHKEKTIKMNVDRLLPGMYLLELRNVAGHKLDQKIVIH